MRGRGGETPLYIFLGHTAGVSHIRAHCLTLYSLVPSHPSPVSAPWLTPPIDGREASFPPSLGWCPRCLARSVEGSLHEPQQREPLSDTFRSFTEKLNLGRIYAVAYTQSVNSSRIWTGRRDGLRTGLRRMSTVHGCPLTSTRSARPSTSYRRK